MPSVKKQSPTSNPTPPPATVPTPTSPPLDEVWGTVDRMAVLLYGRSGTGKTTLWATFPGPILALVCSGGNKPGELRSINTPEYRAKIKPVIIKESSQVLDELGSAREGKYGTVVLDHASGYADLIIKELLGLPEIPVSKAKTAGKGESWSLVSQQQYGQLAVICKETFRGMLNLPCNVIFIAQERKFGGKDEEAQAVSEVITPTIGAALTPSLTGWLNPACDFVLQTFIRPKMISQEVDIAGQKSTIQQRGKGVEYCVRTEPHDVYITKFRVPKGRVLPDVIVDPTYDKILGIIRGE